MEVDSARQGMTSSLVGWVQVKYSQGINISRKGALS